MTLALLALFIAASQRGQTAESPFIVDVWGTADGLPQSSVIALAQTRDGYLWLGTLNGLVRFDGNAFTRFNVNLTPGLPDNRIIFLYEDRHTNLWVGTETAGLCRVKDGAIENFPDTVAAGKISGAVEDEAGNVWFKGETGTVCSSPEEKVGLVSGGLPPQLFWKLLARATCSEVLGHSNVVWHLSDGRVQRFVGEKMDKDFGPVPWKPALVYSMRPGTNGHPEPMAFDLNVSCAVEDAEGNLVVGTTKEGIYRLLNGIWYHIGIPEGLSHDIVLSLCADREGNVWVGTDGASEKQSGGLNRLKLKNFYDVPGLPAKTAQSIAEDAQGGMWVAFNSRGIFYWRTNFSSYYGVGTLSNAWTMLVDSRQQIWAGTRGEGLFRFMSYYFQPVGSARRVGKDIFALYQGRDGKIWVGSENGLASSDGTNWVYYTTNEGLPPGAVRALTEDAAGNLWIGTQGGGVFRLHDGKITSANAPAGDISCLLVDRDNVLWAGTSGHGLARFQNGSWMLFSARDGLSTDNIGYLLEDGLGNLWIGSYEGIMRASKKSFADYKAGTAKIVACRTFLTQESSLGAQPAGIRARDGRLWLPTTHGVVTVNPEALQPNTTPPPVVIESVLVDGIEQKTNRLSFGWGGVVELSPANEQLEIHFASLNFSAPKGAQFGARFRYRLEGRDKNPTDIGSERVAHFNKLPPGDYTFRVNACNEDGVWNEAGAALEIRVAPPFWRKAWFMVVVGLMVVGVLAGIVYLISTAKLKRQLRAARQKELIEKERARIARDLHDQVGANLTQVALLGEMAEADKHLPEEIEQHAQQIYATARETTRSLDEIVWSLNSANDTLEGLANYACKYAQDYFALAGVSFRSELPALPATPILPDVRHNVFLAFKEAVNNVVKHARATEARVKLRLEPDKFLLTIADNGRGLGDFSGKQLRNGLKNMRKRLADIGGEFNIVSDEKGGTVVSLSVPLKEK